MATATATTSDSSSSVRWNIVETHTLEKRKTRDGRKLLNNYELRHTLGRGQFAKVKLCERLSAADITAAATEAPDSATNGLGPPPPPQPTFGGSAHEPSPARRQFAIKCFSKKALERMKEYTTEPPADDNGSSTRLRVVTALDHVRDEIAIMRSLYHRNVVLLFEVIESDASDDLYLVLELLPRGPCMVFDPETRRFASPLTDSAALPDAWVKAHVRDVLSGLAYLHARGICHRDLKPGNVLLSASGRCRLSDFGCARAFADTSSSSRSQVLVSDTVGTYQFLAPECCSGDPYDPFQVDVWATGMLLYVFLYSVLPFTAETTKELFDEITTWDVETHTPPPTGADGSHRELSAECRDLLCRLLARDPSARISAADALQHAWLAEDDTDDEPLSF